MALVNIFTTSPIDGIGTVFRHNGVSFTIDRMGAEGPKRILEGPSYLFIDWVLPEMSGNEVCRRLRLDPRTAEAHLTLVLEEDDAEVRRQALRAGADDYILGPVDRMRILDRVMALQAGRTDLHSHGAIVAGDLTVDLDAIQARWGGRPLRLAQNEFRLLLFLAENPNRVFSRADIIEGLGKHGLDIQERAVDVWMKRLRAVLQEVGQAGRIRTVKGMGYVLDLW